MKPIPTFRVAHLLPYIEYLRKIGAPVERGLRQAKLPTMLVDQYNAYLPLTPGIAFLEQMSKSQGIDDLGLRAVRGVKFTDLNGRLVAALHGSPTLLSALESFCKLSYLDDANTRFVIIPQGTTVKIKCLSNVFFDSYGQQCDDWGNLLASVAIVQAFAGPTWHPKEMAFHLNLPISRFASDQFLNTRFRTGQEAAWITVPRALLSLPLRARPGTTGARFTCGSEQASIAEATLDFPSSLKRVLATYLGDGYPSVQFAAELAGISVRTLQRRLRQSNTSHSDLVQQARFEVASTLLRDTNAKIIDIAYEVGYEDPTHFTRAFRRLAGICPSEYRRQHCFQ